MDFLLTEILEMVREHSKIDYIQFGEHKVNITVTGDGVISELVRNVLTKFNTNEKITTFLSNDVCLPNPHMLPSKYNCSSVVNINFHFNSIFFRLAFIL